MRWLPRSQLPFGWVCFSNTRSGGWRSALVAEVSIAFRLGLFL